jgi:hypothetical protein
MTIKQQGGIFGRNPSFNDVDVNSLDVSGPTTTDTLQADTSINVDGPVTADAGSVFDAGTNFVPDSSASNKSLVLGSSGAAAGTNQLGASVAFSRINTTSPRAAIAAIETDGSYERMGLAFYTHRTNNGSDPMVRSMMIRHDGHVFIDNTNLVFSTAGTGIDFSATSGSGTSELFSDYEEGTFTPYFESSGATFNNNTFTGTYTKVGRLVHITMYCSFPTGVSGVSGTTSNTLFIKGLPFTPTAGGSGNVRAYKVDYPTGDWLYPEIRTDNSIRLYMIRDNNFFVDWTAAAFDVAAAGAAMSFGLVGTYTAD